MPADSFTPRPFRQRYSVSEPGRSYRNESLDGDFTAALPVDDIGVVIDYPEFWQHVQAEEPIR
ncbi:putative glycolipid-binding domain-containing protein [Hartmannibacter diazotrophicus]|uniref:putative glycolipid-binding domain-containing protein n=1 Tax=Hartmannibacter diazotrophicus TaxID=1482074 RepID=UPI003CCC2755